MSFAGTVGQLTQPAATGNQAINTVGFQPKAVLFWGVRSANQTAAAGWVVNYGMAVSSSSRASISNGSASALATTDVYSTQSNATCILNLNGTGTVTDVADFVSMDSGGFTINWTTVPGAGTLITSYAAFGGADMTNASIVQFQSSGSTGDVSYTGAGFMPDAIIFISVGNTTAPSSTPINAMRLMIGGADRWLGQASTSVHSDDNAAAANTSKWQRIDSCINICGQSEAQVARATLKKMDADGFTLTWNTASANMYMWALCLKGGSTRVGSFSQKTSTGSQFINTQNLPDVFFTMQNGVVAATTPAANARWGWGATSGSAAEQSMSLSDLDAADPTDQDRQQQNDAANFVLTSAAAVVAEAELTSFDEHSAATPGGGTTLNWVTADAVAREMWFLSLGVPSGPKLLTSGNAGQ